MVLVINSLQVDLTLAIASISQILRVRWISSRIGVMTSLGKSKMLGMFAISQDYATTTG